MDNLNIIPKATTPREQYWRFLITGGDASLLPKPTNKRDEFLYALCLFRGNEVGTQSNKAYIKAVLNSDSNGQNFFSTFYDLGETKRITEAKVIFRFTLRNTGNDKPASIGAKLFANNIEDRNNITEYTLDVAALITIPEYDKEYTVVANYITTATDKNLSNYRYLKPFLALNKATQGKDKTHGIDIHEVTLVIGDEKIDLTKTVKDFGPQASSKVEIIENKSEPKSDIEVITVEETYIKALLNSGSAGQNYFSTFYDLGADKKISEAKVKFRFTLRDTGNDKPSSIGAKLFANNVEDRNNISEYCANFTTLQATPEYDKEYTFECSYTAVDSAQTNKQLNTYRYLKPFIVLNKTNKVQTSTHGIDIHEVTLTIGDETFDLLNTVQDFAPVQDGASKVETVKESKQVLNLPYRGEDSAHLGDSQTYGYDPDNGGKQLSKTWPEQLKELCGFANARNYGISSSTVATKSSDPGWNNMRNPMCLRYTQMDNRAKVVTTMFGTNDHTQNVPLGEKNVTNKNTDTFYGATNVLFEGLKTKYPDSRIIAIPMMYYKIYENDNGNTIDEFRDITIELAKHHGLEIYDIQKDLSFNVKENKNAAENMTDLVHKNQKGTNEFAKLLAEYINNNTDK